LISPFLQKVQKCTYSPTRLGGADAVVLQNNCVRITCPRSLRSV